MPPDLGSQLLEREAELGALEAAISVGTGGAGRVLVVEGAAGVGKSVLLDAARNVASSRGLQVLSARGSELMQDVPFGVAVELFSERLKGPASVERDALFEGAAGLATSLFWPGTESEPAAAPDPSLPMAHGLYWLLVNLIERAPCLVVVDDAHWVDEASLAFLVYLVERVDGLPLTVLIALRPEDAAMGGRPMARLRAVPTDRVLHLEPLSKDATTALIRSRYFPDADAEFCGAVFDASRGNPFITQELARAADLDGVPPLAASADYVRALAPESTVRAVRSRISRLPPEAWQLAQAVAVLGDDAHFRHAAALAGLDGEAAVTAADALMGAGVLMTGDPFSFSHPIIATAIYASISPARRASIHARAVTLLAGEDPHPERLAHHLMQSPALGDPTVVERLLTAAGRAVSLGAPTTAVRYLERALAEPPSASMRAIVLAELGRVAAVVGDPAALQHLNRALDLLDSHSDRAAVVLDIGRTMLARGHHQEASAALHQGLEELGTGPAPLRLGLLTALLQASRVYPAGRSAALVAEAEAALPAGDEPGRRRLLAELSFERLLAGRPCEEVRNAAREALSGTTLLHEVGPNGLAYFDAVAALIWADDLDAAARSLDVAQVEADRCGWVMSIATASHRRALLRWQQGAVADAAAEAQRAVSAADLGWAVSLPGARAVLALALLEQGDRSQAVELLDFPDPGGQWRDTLSDAFILHARACLAVVREDHQAAVEHALAAGQVMTESLLAPTAAILPWRSTAASALHALGDHDAARRLAVEELDLARAFGAHRPIGIALRVMGVVEGGAAGIEHLEEAARLLSGTPCRLETARTLVDLGGALRRAGRRADAIAHLDEALELAERCGSMALVERARQELVEAGCRPRRRAQGTTVLTAAEQRVARLAASRFTNREIAQKLFVSNRAVEFHLSNIFAKFGISSRRELSAALGDEVGPSLRLSRAAPA